MIWPEKSPGTWRRSGRRPAWKGSGSCTTAARAGWTTSSWTSCPGTTSSPRISSAAGPPWRRSSAGCTPRTPAPGWSRSTGPDQRASAKERIKVAMNLQRLGFFAAAWFGLSLPAMADSDAPPLKKGDRIVFLGDSITQAGLARTGYVTLIKNRVMEKHKDLGIEVIGAGISGNKVPDLQKRLDKDVLAMKPTLVVIYIGINDVWHGEKDRARGTPKGKFEAGLKDIISKIQDAGARVVLCTPTVIGEKKAGTNSLDAQLNEYADVSRAVARETGAQLCDLRKAFQDHLAKNNPGDKEKGVLTTDRVHLNEAGNKFVAETILSVIDK